MALAFPLTDVSTAMTVLGVGLFALAVAALVGTLQTAVAALGPVDGLF